jgi:formate-dependent nitrite reductase cytochrome c552 subunit
MPGKFGEPVKLWQGSIHAENGIACNACHGGDPGDAANAMKKERGFLGVPTYNDVPAFCGRCHVGVLKDYLASGHGRALAKGGPNCVVCHGSHQIVRASLELINEKSCSRCHSYDRAKLIRGAMQETEGMIVALDARIIGYKQVGTDTERLEKELFAVRNRFHSLFHNVDVKKVVAESAQIKGELHKITAVLNGLDEQGRRRKLVGAVAVSATLLAALLVHLLRKTFK